MNSCIFCRIVNKEIPAEVVFEDDLVLAFFDINPQAPFHVLIIPKKHIILDRSTDAEKDYFGSMIFAAKEISRERELGNGYRLVINNGPDSNQEIEHLHMHLLAGKNLGKMLS